MVWRAGVGVLVALGGVAAPFLAPASVVGTELAAAAVAAAVAGGLWQATSGATRRQVAVGSIRWAVLAYGRISGVPAGWLLVAVAASSPVALRFARRCAGHTLSGDPPACEQLPRATAPVWIVDPRTARTLTTPELVACGSAARPSSGSAARRASSTG